MNEMMRAFGVTDADVDALRQGRLSERQRNSLKTHNTCSVVTAMSTLIIVGVTLAWYSIGQPWMLAVACVVVLVIGAMLYAHLNSGFEDAERGTVERATGIITRKQWESEGDSYLYLDGGRYVLNRYRAFNTFVEGRRYTIYYRPRTRTIIYAEPA